MVSQMMLIRRPAANIEATAMPAVERPEPEVGVEVSVVVDWAGERVGWAAAVGAGGGLVELMREELVVDVERVVCVDVRMETDDESSEVDVDWVDVDVGGFDEEVVLA
jgi:hypothetical protein